MTQVVVDIEAVIGQFEKYDDEIRRLRAALERKQRPEAETIDGVIAWIKEDAERLAKARAALGEGKE